MAGHVWFMAYYWVIPDMDENSFLFFTAQAMKLVLYLSMPAIVVATLVGLIIGLFQALTSIQEQTLPHGFKLVAVMIAIGVTVRWLGPELYNYTISIFDQIALVHRWLTFGMHGHWRSFWQPLEYW